MHFNLILSSLASNYVFFHQMFYTKADWLTDLCKKKSVIVWISKQCEADINRQTKIEVHLIVDSWPHGAADQERGPAESRCPFPRGSPLISEF
jgi:hypothetical protein